MIIIITALLIFGFSFCIWYVLYGVSCALNGATLNPGNQFLMPFRCFWEDLAWVGPGSRKRKGDYIRNQVRDWDGAMCSSTDSWDYDEIRKHNLYEEVGMKMLPGWKHFLFMHICVPFGPVLTFLGYHYL